MSYMVSCIPEKESRRFNSVTLPKELVETQNIKENQCVEITVKKCPKNGFGMFKGMSPFTRKTS